MRADSESSPDGKKELSDLSRACMLLVDAMVKDTEEKMASGGNVMQEILIAAADENGEWTMPLAPAQLTALRAGVAERRDEMDEAALASAYAWIRKAADDGLDGVVDLLQLFLQIYAADALSAGVMSQTTTTTTTTTTDPVLEELLAKVPADEWAKTLRGKVEARETSEVALMESLQRRMEGVVLNLPSGSLAQRVQAEYLKEFEARAKAVFEILANEEKKE